jgi:Uma2 family endonuclease
MAKVAEKPLELIAKRSSNEEGQLLFSYQDALELEKVGVIPEDEHTELLGGHFYLMTIQPPHAFAVDESSDALRDELGKQVKVLTQRPLRLSDDMADRDLPQPDVLVLKPKRYLDHPKPEDVYFLIEVSDSTLKKDKTIKLPLYASSGVLETWIINLIERQIEIYSDIQNGSYQQQDVYALTAAVPLRAFGGLAKQWLPEDIHQLLDKFKT